MSSERKIDPFAALILVISFIAIILIVIGPFMAFWLPYYNGVRYSCFTCEYYTLGDLAAQIFAIILFILQIIIVLNDLVPKPIIKKNIDFLGMALAGLTIIVVVIGAAIFIITYIEYDSWPELGFYAGVIGGIINVILFVLKYKNK
ncbi:MAG: hypothetical protein ACFFD2_24280 [Promethearchaeota archaeon]